MYSHLSNEWQINNLVVNDTIVLGGEKKDPTAVFQISCRDNNDENVFVVNTMSGCSDFKITNKGDIYIKNKKFEEYFPKQQQQHPNEIHLFSNGNVSWKIAVHTDGSLILMKKTGSDWIIKHMFN
jgi:hypothetical protein